MASTPNDYAKAVIDGLSQGIKDLELRPQDISEISHGFTVATNAILEGKGERTALITTEGFRDVLELARIRIPRLYDLYYQKPPPLVERRLRLEVGERMTFAGEILKPISKEDVDAVVTAIEGLGVKSVAVSLLHSYANPAHEEMIVDAIKSRWPDVS